MKLLLILCLSGILLIGGASSGPTTRGPADQGGGEGGTTGGDTSTTGTTTTSSPASPPAPTNPGTPPSSPPGPPPDGSPLSPPPEGTSEGSPPGGSPLSPPPEGTSEGSPPGGSPLSSPPEGTSEGSPPGGSPLSSPPEGTSEGSPPEGASGGSPPEGASMSSPHEGASGGSPQGPPPEGGPPLNGSLGLSSPIGHCLEQGLINRDWCCRECERGYRFLDRCSKDKTKYCAACKEGEWSNGSEYRCNRCTLCLAGTSVATPCTPQRDTRCKCDIPGTKCANPPVCTRCATCPPGEQDYTPEVNQVNCHMCPAGTYKSEEGLGPCQPWTKCPPGTTPEGGSNTRDMMCIPHPEEVVVPPKPEMCVQPTEQCMMANWKHMMAMHGAFEAVVKQLAEVEDEIDRLVDEMSRSEHSRSTTTTGTTEGTTTSSVTPTTTECPTTASTTTTTTPKPPTKGRRGDE